MNFILFFISISIVFYTTLFPLNFTFDTPVTILINQKPSFLIAFGDVLRNFLLFYPFGFSLGNLLRNKKYRFFNYFFDELKLNRFQSSIICVFAISFLVSSSIEFAQLFLPERSTNIIDIISNSVGAIFGFITYKKIGQNFTEKFLQIVQRKAIALINKKIRCFFLIYIFLIITSSTQLQTQTRLSNWSNSHYLSFGNEVTGDRPWVGCIENALVSSSVYSSDNIQKYLSGNSTGIEQNKNNGLIEAIYQFSDDTEHKTYSGASYGEIPPLVYKGDNISNAIKCEKGIFLSQSGWLQTSQPVDSIARNVQRTSKFTLLANVSSADLDQRGPARIVSYSANSSERNFTLGQSGKDLVFRMRTPISGVNGGKPSFRIPEVFKDKHFHKIAIIYNGDELNVFIDQFENIFKFHFSPGATIFWKSLFFPLENNLFHFPVIRYWELYPNSISLRICEFIYYTLVFIPFSILLNILFLKNRNNLPTLKYLNKYGYVLFFSLIFALLLETLTTKSVGGGISSNTFLIAALSSTIGLANRQ